MIEESKMENELAIDSVAIVSIISACSRLSEKCCTEGIHGFVIKKGLDRDAGVGNTLMDAYAKCGEVGVARNMFCKLTDKDVVS